MRNARIDTTVGPSSDTKADAMGCAKVRTTLDSMARLVLASTLALGVAACGPAGGDADLTPVKLMLDWVPNTNHTGLIVARDLGYFADAGLEVELIEPGEVYAQQAVSTGLADFGISFQEELTLARADGVPLVSVAAVIQHNSSGFAVRGEIGATGPDDFAGLRYGSFGSQFELPTLRSLVRCALEPAGDGPVPDAALPEIVEIGFSDPLPLLETGRIDMAWIFRAWQGVQAERLGIDLDYIMLADHTDCIPDYYTPIIIASEATVVDRADLARAFVGAVARGYEHAIEQPRSAAQVLVDAVPEIAPGLAEASQAWLSPRYRADAPRWGHQRLEVWQNYAEWMRSEGILGPETEFDPAAAFTNDFLPAEGG